MSLRNGNKNSGKQNVTRVKRGKMHVRRVMIALDFVSDWSRKLHVGSDWIAHVARVFTEQQSFGCLPFTQKMWKFRMECKRNE